MVAEISGLPFATQDFEQLLDDMGKKIESDCRGNYISITNTESMYHARRIPAHFDFIKNANHSLCDGIGVCIAGLAWGVRVPRRNGPILMLRACEHGQALGWRHYLYGGKEGVTDLLEKRLIEKFPRLQIVGKYTPPFRPLTKSEAQYVAADIEKSRPDIVWVGLGLLKQEAWIEGFQSRVNVPWMIGVGAAFDYHAGTVAWAPPWIQAIGMEWLYRTIIQPRQRIKRYIWSFQFMFESIAEGLKHRLKGLVQDTI